MSVTIGMLCAVCAGADWPGFRGPTGMGVSEDKNIPLTWSDTKNIQWKIKLPGSGSLSPIVYGDKVFVTCYSGYGTEESRSAASPILYKDLVIVNASEESVTLYALDKKTGKEVWKLQSGKLGSTYGTPLLIDLKGGQKELLIAVPFEVWLSQDGSYVPSPVIYDGHIYWVSDRGEATCLEARSGKQIYKEKLEVAGRGKLIYASVVLVDDKLYAVSRWGGTYVIAAKPQFELLAHNTIESDTSDFNASPAISNGQMFLRSNQFLYCIQKK